MQQPVMFRILLRRPIRDMSKRLTRTSYHTHHGLFPAVIIVTRNGPVAPPIEYEPCSNPDIVFAFSLLPAHAHHEPSSSPIPKPWNANETRIILKDGCSAAIVVEMIWKSGATTAMPSCPYLW